MSLAIHPPLTSLAALTLLLPDKCASSVSALYRNYPLARHAPDAQFKLHPNYMRLMGAALLTASAITFVRA